MAKLILELGHSCDKIIVDDVYIIDIKQVMTDTSFCVVSLASGSQLIVKHDYQTLYDSVFPRKINTTAVVEEEEEAEVEVEEVKSPVKKTTRVKK